MVEEERKREETGESNLIGGVLDILGLRIDLGELLASPESLGKRLSELQEKLRAVAGDQAVVSGHVRTRGPWGSREFHLGTLGKTGPEASRTQSPEEDTEPPLDIIHEPEQVVVVADVPGVGLQDMEVKLQGQVLSIATRGSARRNYRKTLTLEGDLDPDSMSLNCRNGVLEVRIGKRKV
ncbi:MAG: Hsp20 family protein [Chloroflexi bacterium]|nr:Hsp20 family protein [Chloroflexota bacterium]